jgi:hypothetical protein
MVQAATTKEKKPANLVQTIARLALILENIRHSPAGLGL